MRIFHSTAAQGLEFDSTPEANPPQWRKETQNPQQGLFAGTAEQNIIVTWLSIKGDFRHYIQAST
jgi:hypothetical protein